LGDTPFEVWVENRDVVEWRGSARYLVDGRTYGGRDLRISPGCAEPVKGEWPLQPIIPAGLYDQATAWLKPSEDWLTSEQLWWYTWINGNDLDHWPDADESDGSGRRMHYPFPLAVYGVAEAAGASLPVLQGIRYYTHVWTHEQQRKRPDGAVTVPWGPDEDQIPRSQYGYTATSDFNATVDLLYADVVLNGSQRARARIVSIVERLWRAVDTPTVRHARTCGNVAQAYALAWHVTGNTTYLDRCNELLDRVHTQLDALTVSILANASWTLVRLGVSSDTTLVDRAARFSQILGGIVERWTAEYVRATMPFHVLDPLAIYHDRVAAESVIERVWEWMATAYDELPHSKREGWGVRGNRYLLRYAPHAMGILGANLWRPSAARFPYSKSFPHHEQPTAL
jgi:hypothetical protein